MKRMRYHAIVFLVVVAASDMFADAGVASAQVAPAAAPTAASAPAVGPGDKSLNASVVRAGTSTYRMTARNGENSFDIGTATQDIRRVAVNGDTAIVIVQTLQTAGGTSVDSSVISSRTLAPIRSVGRNAGRVLSLDFTATKVSGESRDLEGSAHAIEQPLAQPVFHGDAIDIIVAALPLRAGYAARIPVYVHDDGGVAWHDVKVTGERAIDGVTAWDVTITAPNGVMRYEIGKTDHQNHGAELKAPNGMVITMTRTGG